MPFIVDSEDTYEPGTIVYVTHSEDPYSGEATVGIKRTDWWNGKNLAGYQIVIGYGYHTPAHEWSPSPPLYVVAQHEVSKEGEALIELVCIDLWQKMDYHILGPDPVTGDPKYMGGWIRDMTIQEIVTDLLSQMDPPMTFVLDSEDPDSLMSTYTPVYLVEIGTSLRKVLRDLMAMTKNSLEIVSKPTGEGEYYYTFEVHSKYMDTAEASEYSYNRVGVLYSSFSNVRQHGLTIPNHIIFVDHLPTSGSDTYQHKGEAVDLESVARIGRLYAVYSPPETGDTEGITYTDAECQQMAEAILARIQAETNQGRILVPHDCARELYDVVDLDDTARTGETFQGRVGGLIHTYASEAYKDDQRSYNLEIRLGGLMDGVNISSPDAVLGQLAGLTLVHALPPTPATRWAVEGTLRGGVV